MKRYIVFFFLLIIASCQDKKATQTGLEGQKLPDFSLLLPDSASYKRVSDLKPNKPVVIVYFSPSCPYCRVQTEDIIGKIDQMKDIQFVFTTDASFSGMKEFYRHFELDKYDNITTGFDTAHFIPSYYGASAVPYLAIYGADNTLKKAFLGKMYARQIKAVSEL